MDIKLGYIWQCWWHFDTCIRSITNQKLNLLREPEKFAGVVFSTITMKKTNIWKTEQTFAGNQCSLPSCCFSCLNYIGSTWNTSWLVSSHQHYRAAATDRPNSFTSTIKLSAKSFLKKYVQLLWFQFFQMWVFHCFLTPLWQITEYIKDIQDIWGQHLGLFFDIWWTKQMDESKKWSTI